MQRLIALLIVLAMTLSNGAGLAAAICQHEDGRAHAAAMQSADRQIAAQAASEESAEASTDRQAQLAEPAPGSLSIFILPSTGINFSMPPRGTVIGSVGQSVRLAGRSISPLLEPPSA